MSRNRREECLDIFRPGEISLRLEVRPERPGQTGVPMLRGMRVTLGPAREQPGRAGIRLRHVLRHRGHHPDARAGAAARMGDGASQNGPGSNSRPT